MRLGYSKNHTACQLSQILVSSHEELVYMCFV